VSASGRDYAKGSVVTLVPTGLAFVFSGWVIGVICLFVAGGLSLILWTPVGRWLGFHSDKTADLYPDRCGDPKERLRELRLSAKRLAHDLKNFETWWPAVEDENFDDRIGGRPTTHKEAMQTLLYRFARFFSVAWAYECDCPNHRNRDDVIEWVVWVYNALGNDPGGPPDYSLMSQQLHVIGERSTTDWGTAQARPIREADFKVEIEENPHFVEVFMQLSRFLRAAGPGTKARARLEAVAKSAKHVEEKLTPMTT
jgi:hypothetical protein